MASIEVILPPMLENPAKFLEDMLDFARPGLDAELAEITTEIQRSPEMPVHKGQLRQSVHHEAVVRQGESLISAIVSDVRYADVQDRGRKAGARNPPQKAIERWVELQMRAEVDALAVTLQTKYKSDHPRKRKGVSRARGRFKKQAIYLIARGVIRKLKAQGMKGKGFIAKRVDEIADRAVAAVEVEFSIYIERHNAGGAA